MTFTANLSRPSLIASLIISATTLCSPSICGEAESYQVPFSDGSGSYTVEFREQADVMKQDVDAIVNAANPPFLGGGGIDGAIHHAAGSQLMQFNSKLPKNSKGERCPTGSARVSPAYDVAKQHAKTIRYIIGTVGPDCRCNPYQCDTRSAEAAIACAYSSVLLAAAHTQAPHATSKWVRRLSSELEPNHKLLTSDPSFATQAKLPEITSIAFPIISGNIYACDFDTAIAPGMIKGITATMDSMHDAQLPTPKRIVICRYTPASQQAMTPNRTAQTLLERHIASIKQEIAHRQQ